jgi:O-antigen/teichoic acid export membrane protein
VLNGRNRRMSSFVKRFAINVLANIIKSVQTFAAGLMVARGLGPEEYGKMVYLLGTFTAIRQLIDCGSSTAFFTLMSQRQRSRQFVRIFVIWQLTQLLFVTLAVGFLTPKFLLDLIWRGSDRKLVILALLAAYLQSSLWAIIVQIGESQRLTGIVQTAGGVVGLINCGLMFQLLKHEAMSVELVFQIIICEWGVALFLVFRLFAFPNVVTDSKWDIYSMLKEFGSYCIPLIPYSWFSFIYEFSDRWLLQTYGGSVQHAFYGLGQQYGTIAGVATTSLLNVFWKEIAEAYSLGCQDRVNDLYIFVLKSLYLLASVISGFLVPWAPSLISLTLGESFRGGGITLMIMLLYPIHQSMGQVCGAMMYATGHVKASVLLGVGSMIVSVMLTAVLLIPKFGIAGGLGDSSMVFASKTLLVQVISVNLLSNYIVRVMGVDYKLRSQLFPVLMCTSIGCVCHLGVDQVFGCYKMVFRFLLSGFIYISIIIATTLKWPMFGGLNAKERDKLIADVQKLSGLKRLLDFSKTS